MNEAERSFIEQSVVQREREEQAERQQAEAERKAKERELEQARALAEAERARAQVQIKAAQRQRYFVYGLAVLLIGMVAVAAFAFNKKATADRALKVAEEQKTKADQMSSRASVSLARNSQEKGNNSEALASLAQALQFDPQNHEAVSLTTALLVWKSFQFQFGEPIQHQSWVNSVQFSPDGQRVVTASWDKTARLWDVPALTDKDAPEDVRQFSELAEALGGGAFMTSGGYFRLLTPEERMATRKKIAEKFPDASSQLTPLQRFMRWSVADPRRRTISPFSKLTVPEWIENRIKEGDIRGLRETMQLDPGNPPSHRQSGPPPGRPRTKSRS